MLCPVCGGESAAFLPLAPVYAASLRSAGCPYPVERFETLNVAQYHCPSCGCSDRDRLMALYFLRHWIEEGRAADARVLEIAPAAPLSAFLAEFSAEYRSGDLMPGRAMDQIDVTDMHGYPAGRFDIVFCSHVLEHVPDDRAALRELHRILTPGGAAVLLVPLPLDIRQTDELQSGEAMPDTATRIRRFGQDDHVRMYAREDFIGRIGAAGFELQQFDAAAFPDDDLEHFGIAARSRLYVAVKPGG